MVHVVQGDGHPCASSITSATSVQLTSLQFDVLHLDRGYDANTVRTTLAGYRIDDAIIFAKRRRGDPAACRSARAAGDALEGRTHQLVASNYGRLRRSTEPLHQPPARPVGARDRADHHGQTHRHRRPLPALNAPPRRPCPGDQLSSRDRATAGTTPLWPTTPTGPEQVTRPRHPLAQALRVKCPSKNLVDRDLRLPDHHLNLVGRPVHRGHECTEAAVVQRSVMTHGADIGHPGGARRKPF
jgi:hypothetical protein